MPALEPLKPHPVLAAFDRKDEKSPRSTAIQARKAEVKYAQGLRRVAKHVGDLVKGIWTPGNLWQSTAETEEALRRYARTLEGWARSVADRMIADAAARDLRAWQKISRDMGSLLTAELAENAPIGSLVRQAQADQVRLITSLPEEAAQRVHDLAIGGITEGKRASVIAEEIYRTGDVTRARAMTIARTETGRVATNLTIARGGAAGATGYIWRTAKDGHTRPSHKKMEGRFVAFDEPPTLDGMVGHAGSLPNCRCYPEVVVPGLQDD